MSNDKNENENQDREEEQTAFTGQCSTESSAAPDNDSTTFGGCPVCGRNDGFLNLGRNHWFVCDAHRLRWCWGANQFGCWRFETEEDWRMNWERIKDYAEVDLIV